MRIRVERRPTTQDHPCYVTRDDGATVRLDVRDHAERLPHDLCHLAIESSLQLEGGFWRLVARGAMFRGLEFAGGRSAAGGGRRLIKTNSRNLDRVEELVAAITGFWEHDRGQAIFTNATPGQIQECFVVLDHVQIAWSNVAPGASLVLAWEPPRPVEVVR